MKRLGGYLTAAAVTALFAALVLRSSAAMESAGRALALCAQVIAPSLLPFFTAANLASETGLVNAMGRLLSPLSSRLFGVSGAGGSAFIIGLTGGYPLGASVTADLVRRGEISSGEGARLLFFCNNSGPAFIIGAAGVGVFGGASYGLLLYAAHGLAAVTAGLISRERGAGYSAAAICETPRHSFAEALTNSVKNAVASVLSICGFVVSFSVLAGLLDALGIFTALTGRLAVLSGMGLTASRALLTGLLELGSGIGALRGLSPTPGALALAAFILGWGGLSVHFQTLAVCAGSGVKTARHMAGRLICGSLSAAYAYVLAWALL